MKKLINNLITEVKRAANNPSFIHHWWYIKYHIQIVEKISLELCTKYPKADKDIVLILVWFHDYGKMIDHANQYEATLTAGQAKLLSIGFKPEIVEKIISYMKIFDGKEHLHQAPLEIQIVSSADGASHFVGPFYEFFWKEFHEGSYEALITENLRKAKVDWEKKMVLPEIKEAFREKYEQHLAKFGGLPRSYLDEQ